MATKKSPSSSKPRSGAASFAGAKLHSKEFKVAGENLLKTVKKLVHEGNVRRIVIKQRGKTLLEIPMTAGAIMVVIAPVLAAVGAIAALVTECSIVVEREAGK